MTGQILFEERGQSAGLWTGFRSYGVSVSDYDQDGWDDILFVGQSGVALFRNNTNGTFTNVTTPAGLGYSAYYAIGLFVDWDNDGDPDLFLGRRDTADQNRMLQNENGIFTDISAQAGISPSVRIGSAAAGDYDGDGRVDLYLSTRDAFDQLYRNTSTSSRISFQNVSDLSGMKGVSYSIGMQPTWIDYDQDGDLDVFVVHDGFELSRLHQNNGALPFPNLASPLAIANVGAGNSMGVSWGDIDNDGWQDVYVSRIDSGGLYRNTGGGPFQDVAGLAGADSNGMSWGVVFADLDNDGWEDLPIVNVSAFGGKHPPSLLFRNDQDGTFTDVGAESGFRVVQDIYGLASGDFDRDGRIDLVGASYFPQGQNRLWMNRTSNQNRWIRLKLLGGGGVNWDAIGARVRVVAGGTSYVRSLLAGSSYCSQLSPVFHFGLGSATMVDTVEIHWKGDHIEVLTGLSTDSLYSIRRSATTAVLGDRFDPGVPIPALSITSAYPNPFNGATRVLIRNSSEDVIALTVHDLLGREVRSVLEGSFAAGEHSIAVEMSGLASGLYILRARGRISGASYPLFLLR